MPRLYPTARGHSLAHRAVQCRRIATQLTADTPHCNTNAAFCSAKPSHDYTIPKRDSTTPCRCAARPSLADARQHIAMPSLNNSRQCPRFAEHHHAVAVLRVAKPQP